MPSKYSNPLDARLNQVIAAIDSLAAASGTDVEAIRTAFTACNFLDVAVPTPSADATPQEWAAYSLRRVSAWAQVLASPSTAKLAVTEVFEPIVAATVDETMNHAL